METSWLSSRMRMERLMNFIAQAPTAGERFAQPRGPKQPETCPRIRGRMPAFSARNGMAQARTALGMVLWALLASAACNDADEPRDEPAGDDADDSEGL